MLKRFIGMMCVAAMAVGTVACSSTADTAQGTESVVKNQDAESVSNDGESASSGQGAEGQDPSERNTIKIGVEIYDPTDAEFLALKDYFEDVSTALNVEFVYSEALNSAEDELKFIENCAISGCQAIMGYYNISEVEAANKAIEYEMYYWGLSDNEEAYNSLKDNPYYVGGISYGEGDYEAGKALAEYAKQSGCKKVIIASGGASLGVPMFVNRTAGITENLGDIEVAADVTGFPGDQFFADQSSALTMDGVDAVLATFNGVDFWAQPIASAGKQDTIKLATIGSLNDTFVDAFESGTISFLASSNIQKFGLGVSMIVNAVEGNRMVDDTGAAPALVQGYWMIENAEAAKELNDIQNDQKVYSMDELKSVIISCTPSVTYKDLQALVDSNTLEDIKARKGL